jgi:hydrogenase maturation protein HypF
MAAEYGCQIEDIQHHHAHIASCLAENAIPLNTRPVLGIVLDGLGFGLDGAMWGGEFLLADYRGFERLAHFPNVAMAGGAMAVRQPWRSAFAHLEAAIGWERCKREHPGLDFVSFLDRRPAGTLAAMIRKRVNSPRASSCGRLFDAVAALLGICAESVSYEGQAAIELEALVDPNAMGRERGYPIAIRTEGSAIGLPKMDFSLLWQAILGDLDRKTPASIVSTRFHRGLSRAITSMARLLFEREGKRLERIVALSGGSFQNKLLLEDVTNALRDWGVTVLLHRQVPANDGGLALGQAAVAAARLIETQCGMARKVTLCA